MADVFTQVIVHRTGGMTDAQYNTAVKTVLDAHTLAKTVAVNHTVEAHKVKCYIITIA